MLCDDPRQRFGDRGKKKVLHKCDCGRSARPVIILPAGNRNRKMAPLLILLALLLAALADASPPGHVKRQVSDLRKKYDFVIVGGGTCGLTLADRLSKAFPKSKASSVRNLRLCLKSTTGTVLVIEYGEMEYAPGVFDPPQTVWSSTHPNQAAWWRFNSLPNPEILNKSALTFSGKTVGGSSSVNGMFFGRGSRFDYDAWDALVSPEFKASPVKWNWKKIFPYFKKVCAKFRPDTCLTGDRV